MRALLSKLLGRQKLRMAQGRKSSLEVSGTLVVAAPSSGSIPHHPGVCGLVLGGWHKDLCETKFDSVEFGVSTVLNYSCCSVKIEMAIASLPYPGHRLD